jgi:hypothetical protein
VVVVAPAVVVVVAGAVVVGPLLLLIAVVDPMDSARMASPPAKRLKIPREEAVLTTRSIR